MAKKSSVSQIRNWLARQEKAGHGQALSPLRKMLGELDTLEAEIAELKALRERKKAVRREAKAALAALMRHARAEIQTRENEMLAAKTAPPPVPLVDAGLANEATSGDA